MPSARTPEDLAKSPTATAPDDTSRVIVPPSEFRDPWLEDIRAKRAKNFFWLLVTVAVTSGITYFAVKAYDDGRKPLAPAPAQQDTERPPVIDIETSIRPTERYLGEELLVIRPQTPPTGEAALSIPWIKQAALALVRADQAVEEGRPADALTHYREALRIYPLLQGVRQQMGMIYLSQNKLAEAEEDLRLAVRETPSQAGLLNNLGLVQVQLEKFSEAQTNLLRTLELDPNYTKAMFNLATLYTRMGEDRKAADMFARYLKHKPNDSEVIQKYAGALTRLEEWTLAEKVLTQAISMEPNVAPLLFRLAQVQARNENKEGCLASLRKASELLDHRRVLAWMSQADFDSIRNTEEFKGLTEDLVRSAGVQSVLDPPKPRL